MPIIEDNYPYISDFHDDEVYVFSTIGKGPKGDQGEKGDVTFPTFADPIEWSKETDYPQCTIVLYDGSSYIAKIDVPHGVDITNGHYWQLVNNYDAQMEQIKLTDVRAFDTVADMKAAMDLAPGMTCHTNGFHSIGDGGAAYYKITTDGTPNEMDIIACGNLYAHLLSGSNVNVLALGAIGDRTSNDYGFIVRGVELAYEKNKTLYFPAGREFKTTQGIFIDNQIDMQMNSPIIYNGSGVALTIGTAETTFGNRQLKIMVKSGRPQDPFDNTSVGVRFINVNNCNITLELVEGFYECVSFRAIGTGIAYNTIYINNINSGQILMHLEAYGNDSWVNENLFVGGRFSAWTSFSTYGNFIGILIEGNSTHKSNGNLFIKPSIEHAEIAIVTKHALSNTVICARTEDCTYAVDFQTDSSKNDISIGYGTLAGKNTSEIRPNFIHEYCVSDNEFSVYDSGIMGSKAIYNSSQGTYDNAFCRLAGAGVYAKPHFTRTDGLLAEAYYINGIVVDCSVVKNFNMMLSGSADSTYRAVIQPYDLNGNVIETAGTVKGDILGSFYHTDIGGLSVFMLGSDASGGMCSLGVSDECKSMFIGFRTRTGGFNRFMVNGVINEVSANTNNPARRKVGVKNTVGVGLSAIPTSEGDVGDFCPNSNTATIASVLGWVCEGGSNWTTVNR